MLQYNITNSYDSIYMVHGNAIPDITGTVVVGYDGVMVSEGNYLVPLLYPTAKKLATAAANTNQDGYHLKIYDSFRPYVTTRYIYDTTSAILYNKIPGTEETYFSVMTNNAYGLGSFLASGSSYHNFGVALDLTIVDSDGNELAMQSDMHDLSHYSAVRNNNDAANLLAKYMTDAGFVGISSEWWHFQDNNAINLYATRRDTGVALNGWTFVNGDWEFMN
jgi:D-alanyl-D-alanine dipeptidase